MVVGCLSPLGGLLSGLTVWLCSRRELACPSYLFGSRSDALAWGVLSAFPGEDIWGPRVVPFGLCDLPALLASLSIRVGARSFYCYLSVWHLGLFAALFAPLR